MPYLHWEKKADYEIMRGFVKKKETNAQEPVPDETTPKGRRFLELLHDNHVQIRRSLDQSYYWVSTSQ